MDLATLGTVCGAALAFLGVIAWIRKLSSDEISAQKELFQTKLDSLGRSLDTVKAQLTAVEISILEHDRKISQGDIVMVHIDETLKSLNYAVGKLDDTLNSLKLAFARIENK